MFKKKKRYFSRLPGPSPANLESEQIYLRTTLRSSQMRIIFSMRPILVAFHILH